jgi:hypothetical protein
VPCTQWSGHKNLLAVRKIDGFERLLAAMRRGKGDVAGGVPVLRHHHIAKSLGDLVDDGNDLFAILHRKAAAGQEAVLDVDYQKH